ncbi:CRISPR-associated RAMP protein Csx10 [Oscillatoriales cyanobacterium USR001]|nr:CRISPR-associated RAMP protein Csx10 [Oscillatoriales cyanobacterium USR001]
MKQIELQIKALSPLAISRQKPGGSVSEAMDYIPGSVIRGAIASKILQESGHYSSDLSQHGGEFQALFLGETPAIFRNAYPASLEIDEGKIDIQNNIRILPATVVSSKTKPGFCLIDENKNGVFDTLIDRFCAERYACLYDPKCPKDGSRVEPFSGFYSILNENYYSHSISKRLLTRVGINRRRATAEDQILYSIEALNESKEKRENPIVYSGSILVPDSELANSLKQFIEQRRHNFRVGGSTSRGLGKVEITAKQPIDVKLGIQDRIQKFNEKLRERWQTWKIFNDSKAELSDEQTYFTIGLQSDAILSEQWRRTTVISPEMLKQFAELDRSICLDLHAVYSSYDYLSGWNSAWGLMKDVELITNKGAVYLFSTTQLDSWLKPLGELEMRGVGDRTCEGFGQIRICDEFHLIMREEAV